MPIACYQCEECGREVERLEITTEDKSAPPPTCRGGTDARMEIRVAPEETVQIHYGSTFADPRHTGGRLEPGGAWCVVAVDRAEGLVVLKGSHDPAPMVRRCGSSSFCRVTMRGTWVGFSSNKPPVEKDRHPRGI